MEEKLTLPPVPLEYLELHFPQTNKLETTALDETIQNGCTQPFAVECPFQASIVSAHQLSHGEGVKKVVEICLNVQDSNVEFQPGDTIGLIPQNPRKEVEEILKCLKLLEKAESLVNIGVKPGTLKKKASVPSHIPMMTTLRHIFMTCIDIRAVPKKLFLRMLAVYTDTPSEQRSLEKLCSKEGSADYLKNIVETRTSLLGLLTMFPSCCPPVERILEHVPRLQARPYSIASSPLKNARELNIVYSLLEESSLKLEPGLNFGICTSWLDSLTLPIQTTKSSNDSLLEDMSKLTLSDSNNIKIPIYFRKNMGFTLPEDITVPLILIGPGTGVSPYIGFLQHRSLEKLKRQESVFGEIWLFFGCRYEDRDFLYRSELEKYVADGTLTRLFLSFSRDEKKDVPRYVQDNIALHGKEFIRQIFEKNATLYVCGDAKNMGRDVFEAIVTQIQKERGTEDIEARLILKELQNEGRYLQDIWV